jgi:hypothetical protein
MHSPFNLKSDRLIGFLKEVEEKWKCQRVICLGDEVDFAAISRWPTDVDGFSAGHEAEKAIVFLHQFYDAFPKVRVCTSNHTIRPWKKAFDSGIPKRFLKSYHESLEAPPGWSWHDEIILNGVKYIHGEGFTGIQAHGRAAYQNRMSTVIGHVHTSAGVQYFNNGQSTIFGANFGCLIDINAYAFAYGKKLANKPTLGCGVVVSSEEAYFIPYKGK